MRHILATVMMGALLAFAAPAVLAASPSVSGVVTQVFTDFDTGKFLIAVDGTPYAVASDVYHSVHVGDIVTFDGTNWTIAR